MRLDAPDDRGKRAGPVHRLDARYKLLFTLAFVIAVVATPIGQWRVLGSLGLLLALLVGIFQYTPSPFCILDEVDAPLDEANIARFTELVSELSVQTQFILITHSKRTMSIAPVLYGVTMQEPGVSKLVSVRFNAPVLAELRA